MKAFRIPVVREKLTYFQEYSRRSEHVRCSNLSVLLDLAGVENPYRPEYGHFFTSQGNFFPESWYETMPRHKNLWQLLDEHKVPYDKKGDVVYSGQSLCSKDTRFNASELSLTDVFVIKNNRLLMTLSATHTCQIVRI